MKLTAVEDKIVVKQMVKNVTKGGIIIPGSVRSEPQVYGKVVSVGEDVKTIKVDDLLMYHPKGGMSVLIDDLVFQIVKASEVYCIVEDEQLSKQLTEVKIGSD